MTQDRWRDILGNIKDNFDIEEEGKEHIEDEGGADIEFVVFNGPLGKMRLEFITKPLILDKKTIYSNRIGSETKIEYVYSESEKTHNLNIYKAEGDGWLEVDPENFNL